jgi:hypothetical protein
LYVTDAALLCVDAMADDECDDDDDNVEDDDEVEALLEPLLLSMLQYALCLC